MEQSEGDLYNESKRKKERIGEHRRLKKTVEIGKGGIDNRRLSAGNSRYTDTGPNIETSIRIIPQLSLIKEGLQLLLTFITKRRYGWWVRNVRFVHDAICNSLLPGLPDVPLIRNEHVE